MPVRKRIKPNRYKKQGWKDNKRVYIFKDKYKDKYNYYWLYFAQYDVKKNNGQPIYGVLTL